VTHLIKGIIQDCIYIRGLTERKTAPLDCNETHGDTNMTAMLCVITKHLNFII